MLVKNRRLRPHGPTVIGTSRNRLMKMIGMSMRSTAAGENFGKQLVKVADAAA